MDIVERLNRYAEDWRERASDAGIVNEAAAEINLLRADRNAVIYECAEVAKNYGLHLPPEEERGTEPPEGVAFWGNTIDNRRGNEGAIAASILALIEGDE